MFNSNRKGQLMGTTNALIVATIVVAIILIISFILVRALGTPPTDDVQSAKLQGQAIVSLEAYLQTPVVVNVNGKMQTMEMSELIRLTSLDSNYLGQLDHVTKEIFDSVYGPSKWKVEIFPSQGPKAVIPASSMMVSQASEKIALPGEISVILSLN